MNAMDDTNLFRQDNNIFSLSDEEYFEDVSLEKINNPSIKLEEKEFYNCTFANNIMFKGSFRKCRFEKCFFRECDFSLSKFSECLFIDTEFKDCKLMGIDWTLVSKPLKTAFINCILSDSSFFELDFIGSKIINCKAHNVDFENTNLSRSDCSSTDFLSSKFSNTNLSGADLRDARNYFINPAVNKIKKAKFSYPEVLSLLNTYDITIE
jgi:fluoroquinolone resistance protein